jgi:dynein heavy chain, axonemal
LIVENVQEELEPSIEPVLTRAIIKKASKMFIKLGDSEVEYNKDFRLLMLSKLMNPH